MCVWVCVCVRASPKICRVRGKLETRRSNGWVPVWTLSGSNPRKSQTRGTKILLSPSSYCSPQARPVNWETSCWGKNSIFTRKASQPRRQWSCFPKNHGSGLRILAFLMLKGEGCGWLLQISWSESFVLAAVPTDQVKTCSYKPPTRQMFSLLQLFISVWMEKCYTVKGHSLEKERVCIFQPRGNIPICSKKGMPRLKWKKQIQYGVRFVLLCYKTCTPVQRQSGKRNSIFVGEGPPFFSSLGLRLIGWGPPILGRAICFMQSIDLNVKLTENTLTETANTRFDQISGDPHSLGNLAHRMKHLTWDRHFYCNYFLNCQLCS